MPLPSPGSAQFRYASDQSLLIYFGDEITKPAHEQVRKLLRLLETEPVPGVRNLHPAYCSLLVKFDPLQWRHDQLETVLRQLFEQSEHLELPEPRHIEIPVCYGDEFGPDLSDVCAMRGLTASQAVELHASTEYLVYFLGFVPGFAYLGELPSQLVTPRLETPRRAVPAGSVAVAGKQTGVYPFSTPGGWRLIGRTTAPMFRANRADFNLLSIGDRVKFSPISREQFSRLQPA